MATISVTNSAEMQTVLAAAVGGDLIKLAGGNYGAATITNIYDSEVVIVAADPAAPPVFSNLQINGAANITFHWLRFEGDGSVLPFTVDGCSYIKFSNSVFQGTLLDGFGAGKGLLVSNSDHITVENNEFFHWMKALAIGSSIDVDVLANNIHSCNADGFNFTATNRLLIESNWIHDFLSDPDVGHRDMIQFWNPDPNNPAQNVIIRGNFLDAGTGDRVQSIFMGNGPAFDDPTNLDLYFRNILIEDNVIYNAQAHGVSIGPTLGLIIRNNTLLLDRWVNGTTYHAPQIRLYGPSPGSVVEGNILTKDVRGAQFVVQDSNPNGENYYGDLFVNAQINGPTLADLRAVPGGLIETLGVGAAMTRAYIDIALTAGPGGGFVPSPDPIPDPIPEPDPDPIPEPEPEPMPTQSPIFTFGPKTFLGLLGEAVVVTHTPEMEIPDGTLDLAFTPGSLPARQGLFSKDAAGFGSGGHFAVLLEGRDILIRLQDKIETHSIWLTGVLAVGVDYKLAVTFGPDGMEAWLDGVPVGHNVYTGGLLGNLEPIVIGANAWSSWALSSDPLKDPLFGTVERVALYDRVLTDNEILSLVDLAPEPEPEPEIDPLAALAVRVSDLEAKLEAMGLAALEG